MLSSALSTRPSGDAVYPGGKLASLVNAWRRFCVSSLAISKLTIVASVMAVDRFGGIVVNSRGPWYPILAPYWQIPITAVVTAGSGYSLVSRFHV